MDGADVIAPTIGEVGAALGQEQQMVCSAGRNRAEQCERSAIEKSFNYTD